MSSRFLACITPTTSLDEPIDANHGENTSCDSRPDLQRLKSFTCQLKQLASKVTASAYKLSCSRPCTASVYDQEAAQAVQHRAAPAVVSEDTPRDFHSGQLSLPSPRYHYSINPLKEDESTAPSCTAVLHGSSMADHKHHSKKNWTQYRSQEKRSSEQVGRNWVAVRAAGAEQYSKVSHSNMGHVGGPCLPGKEWFSQVELGVFITFVTLSNGCNAFKRIRFSRDIFSKKEAESWWTENGNRVRAIYNVPPFQQTVTNDRISSSEDEMSGASAYATPAYSPRGLICVLSRGDSMKSSGKRFSNVEVLALRDDTGTIKAAAVTDDRPDESEARESDECGENTCDERDENSWVEEDVPGVYLTLMNLPGGGRDLKRVRFSREKFTEKQAKIWWDENRSRIHMQYI
ncbi:hypothetical protein CY35_02G153800 [Sphagnum magellanicum]|nr:hypothetical protein CY35_02G153800 [Sphagnum magellanicum]